MKEDILRRPYAAPEAELICLAPSEEIASSGWQPWFQQGDAWWGLNSWGKTPEDASITAGFTWLDVYEGNEADYNYDPD